MRLMTQTGELTRSLLTWQEDHHRAVTFVTEDTPATRCRQRFSLAAWTVFASSDNKRAAALADVLLVVVEEVLYRGDDVGGGEVTEGAECPPQDVVANIE
jgi:hypothetical protein